MIELFVAVDPLVAPDGGRRVLVAGKKNSGWMSEVGTDGRETLTCFSSPQVCDGSFHIGHRICVQAVEATFTETIDGISSTLVPQIEIG